MTYIVHCFATLCARYTSHRKEIKGTKTVFSQRWSLPRRSTLFDQPKLAVSKHCKAP